MNTHDSSNSQEHEETAFYVKPQTPIKDSSWFPKVMFFGKIIFITFLVLAMMIPVNLIRSLVYERERRGDEAKREVSELWGSSQTISSPVLVVPYLTYLRDQKNNLIGTDTNYAYFLPESLEMITEVKPEIRSRGIFKIPVYQSNVEIKGNFSKPDLTKHFKIPPSDILWKDVYLTLPIPQTRSIQEKVLLNWAGQKIAFEPGIGQDRSLFDSGIHVPVQFSEDDSSRTFSMNLQLAGSNSLRFIPLGKETEVRVQSSWADPKFAGAQLPTTREVHQNGFTAQWKSQYLGRNYPQEWKANQVKYEDMVASSFGVDFILGVDHYQNVERSIKYSILFILLTFVTFFLFEIFNKIRVHPIQYLLVGFALCLFYAILLALSEHITFAKAYLAGSVAIISLITFYSSWILQNVKRALLMGSLMAILYAYLYSLLQMESYSLLMGTAGLFVILATIMILTRKVDWYQLSSSKK